MPSSRRGDALARAALDLGYVTKPQIEEARRLQLEAAETSGTTPSLMDVLVDRGHLTPDRARLVEQMGDDPTGKKTSPSSTKNKARRATTGQQRRVRHGPTGFHTRATGGLTGADKLRILVGLVSGAVGIALIIYAVTMGEPAQKRPRARRGTTPPPVAPRVSIPKEEPVEKPEPAADAVKGVVDDGKLRVPKARPKKTSRKKSRKAARPAKAPKDALLYGGHWYAVYPKRMAWTDARKKCEELGGHLVTIGSEGENDFVVGLAAKKDVGVWFGLTDEKKEGTFVWVTGEKVSFTKWNEGEPNNSGKGEHYAGSWGGGAWNDFPAASQLGFVCEWE